MTVRAKQPIPKNRLGQRLLRVVRLAVVLYFVVLLMLMLFENKILFPASKFPRGDWTAVERLRLEDVWFESGDNTKLHGWVAEHDTPRGVVLFCHGNAGNVTNRGDVIAYLRDRFGLTAFVFDYRGYGRSEGSPNEAGVLADARAARAWLAKRTDVAPDKLLLLGRSLGSAVAVDLAIDGGAKALILESTFTSVPDAGAAIYPWLPVRWLMKSKLDSLSKIAGYHGPLLVSHGTNDEIIPFALGKRLFDAAQGEVGGPNRVFVPIDGGFHNDPQTPSYYDALEAFLNRILE